MQMLPGLPARVVVVCTLLCGIATARADRRSVAVIDMSGEAVTENLARELYSVLFAHPELQPLLDASLAAALYGDFSDDDRGTVENRLKPRLGVAEQLLARFDFSAALQTALDGQAELLKLAPHAEAFRVFSQFAFVEAQALLGMPRQAAEAPRAFLLAHRLDPTFAPDPARYLPDIVQAFDAAKRWGGRGTVVIAGSGKLYIDGRDEGSAPAELTLDAGPHVIWLTGDERITAGREILVEANKKLTVEIADQPVDLLLKVRRARADLKNASDATSRAAAMTKLALLLGRDRPIQDAVLLTASNGKVVYQTWTLVRRPNVAPGFSALKEYKGATPDASPKPVDVLTALAPPRVKFVPEEHQFDKPVVDERRWYQRRSWQATIVVGAIATVVASYYIYKGMRDDDFTVVYDGAAQEPLLGVRW